MKDLIKLILPEPIKKGLRKMENFLLRARYGFTQPIILRDIYGLRFALYPEQNSPIRWLIERGAHKKEMSAMRKIIRPGYTVFDIGANIGILTGFMAKAVTETGQVFAFEPFPETFRRLKETVTLNEMENVECIKAAVSDKIGIANLYYEATNSEVNSLGRVIPSHIAANMSDNKVTVTTTTIDNVCTDKGIDRIDFLKIDVEGFELETLNGMIKMLGDKRVGIIQFEIAEVLLRPLGRSSANIISRFKDFGYSVFSFDEAKGGFVGPLLSIEAAYDNYYASYKDLERI